MLYKPTIAGSDVGYVVYVHGGGFASSTPMVTTERHAASPTGAAYPF